MHPSATIPSPSVFPDHSLPPPPLRLTVRHSLEMLPEANAWAGAAKCSPSTPNASAKSRSSNSTRHPLSWRRPARFPVLVPEEVAAVRKENFQRSLAPPTKPACAHPSFASGPPLVWRGPEASRRDQPHTQSVRPQTSRLRSEYPFAVRACPLQKIAVPIPVRDRCGPCARELPTPC